MRATLALPLLLLGACQVSSDPANDQTTVQFSVNAAENGADVLIDKAENAAGTIATRAERVANRVDDIDVDVDIKDKGGDGNGAAAADGNRN